MHRQARLMRLRKRLLTTYLVVTILLCVASQPGWADDLYDRILALPPNMQAQAIATEFRAEATRLSGRTLDLRMTKHLPDGKYACRLIASEDTCSLSDDSMLTTGNHLTKNRLASSARRTDCPGDFWLLSWATNRTCFAPFESQGLADEARQMSADGLCARIEGSKCLGLVQHPKLGQVLECQVKRESPEQNRFETCSTYFVDREGSLLFCGFSRRTQAPQAGPGWRLGLHRQDWWAEYAKQDGFWIPVTWGRTIRSEERNYDGTLHSGPSTDYEVTYSVQDCELRYGFPQELHSEEVSE